jgi:hypothetical protein
MRKSIVPEMKRHFEKECDMWLERVKLEGEIANEFANSISFDRDKVEGTLKKYREKIDATIHRSDTIILDKIK